MEKLAERVAELLVVKELIKPEDKGYYGYGLICMWIYAINIITMLILALYVGKPAECIFFLIFFAPLRSYAGGIHMNTWYSCYITSCAALLLFIMLPYMTDLNMYVLGVSAVLSVLALCGIWVWAPCENEKNPLPEDVKKNCKVKARAWGAVIGAIEVLCMLLDLRVYAFLCMEMTVVSVVLIILEKMNSIRKRGKSDENSNM